MTYDKQTPVKRLYEYLQNPDALFLLQHMSPGVAPALCAAGETCLRMYPHENGPNTILPGFRIRGEPVLRRDREGTVRMKRPLHYRPVCFELLCPETPSSLVPHRLKLDGPGWGFIVRKWWWHCGAVDVGRMAEYVADFKAKEDAEEGDAEGESGLPHPRVAWHKSKHAGCVKDPPCAEPVQIGAGQDVMYLRDLQSDRRPVPLSAVMDHADAYKLAHEIWRKGHYTWHYFPEYDAEEGVVPQTAICRLQADS